MDWGIAKTFALQQIFHVHVWSWLQFAEKGNPNVILHAPVQFNNTWVIKDVFKMKYLYLTEWNKGG